MEKTEEEETDEIRYFRIVDNGTCHWEIHIYD